MSFKTSKKVSTLTFDQDQIISADRSAKIKGGGYYCCVRNKRNKWRRH